MRAVALDMTDLVVAMPVKTTIARMRVVVDRPVVVSVLMVETALSRQILALENVPNATCLRWPLHNQPSSVLVAVFVPPAAVRTEPTDDYT